MGKYKPTEKSPEIEAALDQLAGEKNARANALEGDRCLSPPIGCGQKITNFDEHFRDATSIREYQISGLCQDCQDEIFGT